MLTFEALMKESRERGMPSGKTRSVLREYLQVLTLKELSRLEAGKKFFFTGGTYLRLVHGAKRFSEDLDFNSEKLTRSEFEKTLRRIAPALKKEGMDCRLRFSHWRNLLVAEMIFPDIERAYAVKSKYSKKEGIVIKLEATTPRWKIKPETLLVSGFGQMYPVLCSQKGALFADKIDALLKKNRARHLFDTIFMLSKNYPIDTLALGVLGIKEPPLEAIIKRVEGFSITELKRQAEEIRPFLFDESEAQLIANAKTIIPQLVGRYPSSKAAVIQSGLTGRSLSATL
jgi:hypothetical protein